MTDDCAVLFDFSDPAARDAWFVRNDTVMGGNSRGRIARTDASIVFSGDLVTRGGGFAQAQAPLPDGALAGMTALRLVAASDGRPWRVRVDTDVRVPRDAMRGRGDEGDRAILRSGPGMDGPRVSFSAPLGAVPRDAPGPVSVPMTAPTATTRGRPVPDAAFTPGTAHSIGLILADGRDAPFRLEVARIEACR